ncbi:MAG: CDP-alcohol phosphatidyltransferase family protein [Candidatus Zixiibacteriota bacterium]|nr:MAG: CDP-alcohol phosphatidyltransferase family protein [candidate division Zixibacteria bacterium]
MIQINKIKREFYERSTPGLGRLCLKLGFTPNMLTGISFLSAIISGIFFWTGNVIWGVIWMLVNAITDMLDGATARAGNMGTTFGAILDHVSDRYGEFFILAGITMSGLVHPGWGLFALFGMIIASYTRAAAESMGKIENCAVGFMGRLEKFLLIIVGAMLEYYFAGTHWLEIALIAVGASSYITSVQRLIYTHKILKGRKRNKFS